MEELFRLFRMYFLPDVIFYAYYKSSNGSEHQRMKIIKDGRTTKQDFINWMADNKKELSECVLTDFRIVR